MAVTWSATNKNANVVLSGGNLVATGSNTLASSASGIATLAVTTGQLKYFELTATHVDNSNSVMLGVGNSSTATSDGSYLGIDSNSFAFIADGRLVFNNSVPATITGYTNGDVIGIAVDFAHGTIWRRINGGSWNDSGTANPVTNTGGFTIGVTGDLFPAYCTHGGGGDQSVTTANFGATSFGTSPPSGFTGLDSSSGVSLSLAATEATDTASFSASLSDSLSLAATEAKDTAAFSASLSDLASLAATESTDVASFALSIGAVLSLAATETADTASFAASLSDIASLAALEAQDTASFTLNIPDVLSLAATESPDIAAFTLQGADPQVLAQVYGGSALWKRKKPKTDEVERYIETLVEQAREVLPIFHKEVAPQRVMAIVKDDPSAAFLANSKRQLEKLEKIVERVLESRRLSEEDDEDVLLLS